MACCPLSRSKLSEKSGETCGERKVCEVNPVWKGLPLGNGRCDRFRVGWRGFTCGMMGEVRVWGQYGWVCPMVDGRCERLRV